ncbi:MAG: hypothetical protein RLZZ628_3067 [Bacteroidota bacterium]
MKKTILMSLFVLIGCAVQAQSSAKKPTQPPAAKPLPTPAPQRPAPPSRKPEPPTTKPPKGKPL